MTELRPLVPGRLLVGGCPEGFDARYLAEAIARAGGPVDPRRARRRPAGGDAGVACASSRRSCRCCASRPGTACPTTASRRTPRSPLAHGDAGRTRRAASTGRRRCSPPSTPRPSASRPRDVVAAASFVAEVGGRVDVGDLRGYLARMGFQQAPTVTEPGEFAIRGGLIDIYPPGARGPVRLDLFGDVLESARRFDPETQRTSESVRRVELAPVSEVILDEAAIQRFRTRYRGDVRRRRPRRPALRGDQRRAQACRATSTGCRSSTSGWRRSSTTSPARRCSSTTRPPPRAAARWAALADQYDARAAALAAKSKLGTVYKPVPPGELYLDDAAWDAATGGRPLHQLSALPQPLGPGVIDAGGRIGRDFAPERQQEAISLFGALAAHVAARRRSRRRRDRQLLRRRPRAARGPPRRQRRHRRARHRPRGRPPRRPRPQPRRLAARARLRGAGPHRHLRAGRARRPADPRRPAAASAPRTS